MLTYTQANRPLALSTPIGPDALLLAGLKGSEALSSLFSFQLDLLAEQPVSFDQLLGQPASIRISVPDSPERQVNGIITRLRQGAWRAGIHGQNSLLSYQADLSPRLWLLGRRTDSRIFEQMSVPDILSAVLHNQWQLDTQVQLSASYPRRDYCVQYQETDLAFVTRLMEEEGIYYYFIHTADKHTLVLADSPSEHPDLPGEILLYDDGTGGQRLPLRVTAWFKAQKLRTCKQTLRDFWFELPDNSLEAIRQVPDSVTAGLVQHRLAHQVTINGVDLLERYDNPAGYGWRFDQVGPGGGAQPDTLHEVFGESERVAGIRAQQEAAEALLIDGASPCGHLQPGYRFRLQHHFDGDGPYLLTRVEHTADLRSAYLQDAANESFLYQCAFQAIPGDLPYRPQRVTPKPRIAGYQTAMVVGPPGQDIFVDQFGRVKVKFHWDRRDSAGPNSSCWLRVAQVWAGNRWGAFFWPRVGHEVVVAFEEGDPDRPLIVGNVYNSHNMPPFVLPLNRTLAGFKSFSSSGLTTGPCDPITNFNGILFDDTFGEEHIEIHGEKQILSFCENNTLSHVNGPHRTNVNGKYSLHVGAVKPPGSGSGGGFEFSAHTDLGQDLGVNLSSTCGVNQGSTLGVMDTFTVGDRINLTVNPLGLVTDMSGFAGTDYPAVQTFFAAVGATFGGLINLTLGNTTSISVGSPVNISRGGRATVASTANFQDGNVDATQKGFLIASEALALLSATLATAGMIRAGLNSYSISQDELIGWFGSAGLLTVTLAEIELANAIYTQIKKLKSTAEASATGVMAKGLAATADALVTLFKNDQKNLNKLAYTSGTRGDYSIGAINGAKDLLMLFAGDTLNQQTVLAMDSDNIKLAMAVPDVGPRILMASTPTPSITLAVGPPNVGPRIVLTDTSITLAVGTGPAMNSISIGVDNISLGVAGATSSISMRATGITSTCVTSEIRISPDSIGYDATEIWCEAVSAMNITAASLTETVEGTVTRTAGDATLT